MYRLWLALLLTTIVPMKSEVVSTKSAEHYRWGDCCDGWYLVKNDRMTVIQERMPPASSEIRHYHGKAQQFFYVLKGEGTIEMGTRVLTLHEGEGLLVAPHVLHRVRNLSRQDLLLQVTSEPPSHGDRFDSPKS